MANRGQNVARYLGFDGFRHGWVMAWIDDDGGHGFDYSCTIDRLLRFSHKRAMIDIPIGLPERGPRACDRQARSKLGPSVFPGVRRSLLSFNCYPEANETYHGRGEAGISKQLWNIREKIGEIDEVVASSQSAALYETHPEMFFYDRNGCRRLPPKTTESGRARRIEILKNLGFDRIEQFLAWRYRTGIGREDLIDACACAVTARDMTSKRVLGDDARDDCGLRMEIHY